MRITKRFKFKNKIQIRLLILIFLIAVISLVFVLNLFARNKNADAVRQDISSNVEKIASFDFSDVKTVEAEIEAKRQAQAIAEAAAEAESQDSTEERNYFEIFSNCVVIGDSITHGLYDYGFLSEFQVVSEIGASVLYSEDTFNSVAALYPKAVFFAFGMNDMGNYNGDEKAFIDQYKSLLTDFKKNTPDTTIFICSITPPAQYAIDATPVLGNYENFNKEIKKMCRKLDIEYIDTTVLLEGHEEFYAGDGIHVSPEFYVLWLELMSLRAGL